jgi:hypothetical protein
MVESSSIWATTNGTNTSTAMFRTCRGDRRAQGINPLDDGILYVAKFHADGTGQWLPLTPDNPSLAGWSLNDILINTRGAADAVGATMMDRPEWIDTFPRHLTALATLTNNSRRGTTPPSVNNPDGTTIPEPSITTDISSVGAISRIGLNRHSAGISLRSVVTQRTRSTVRRFLATSMVRRTGYMLIPAACSGSRLTSRHLPSMLVLTRTLVITKCWRCIPRREKPGGSWSARTSAKSPVSS